MYGDCVKFIRFSISICTAIFTNAFTTFKNFDNYKWIWNGFGFQSGKWRRWRQPPAKKKPQKRNWIHMNPLIYRVGKKNEEPKLCLGKSLLALNSLSTALYSLSSQFIYFSFVNFFLIDTRYGLCELHFVKREKPNRNIWNVFF